MLVEDQIILENRYKICKRLGSGAFGEIYKGIASQESLTQNSYIVEKIRTGEFFAAKIVS